MAADIPDCHATGQLRRVVDIDPHLEGGSRPPQIGEGGFEPGTAASATTGAIVAAAVAAARPPAARRVVLPVIVGVSGVVVAIGRGQADLEPLPDDLERPPRGLSPDSPSSDPAALRPPALPWESAAP